MISCYVKNDIIAKEFKINSIRKAIKNLAKNFYNNPNSVDKRLIKSLSFYNPYHWNYRK